MVGPYCRHAVGQSVLYAPPVTVVKNPVVRGVLMALGWLWVVIAFVGIVVPGLPTTGPILLAAFLFSKSSERFDRWLLTNRFFGGIVRDWRSGNGFTVRGKTIAVGAIVLSFGITTIWFVTAPYARLAMWLLAISIATYIVTRPTKTRGRAAERVSA
ncbi:MAG: DUF454 domain-containing protein [Actinobacteria bacterium]|nr:MAG: DUF454 domain-containing protein [Actinomycetota bacterium]